MDNKSLKKLENELWEAADLLRQGSKLTSQQYCINALKEAGRIERVGGKRYGHWEINE